MGHLFTPPSEAEKLQAREELIATVKAMGLEIARQVAARCDQNTNHDWMNWYRCHYGQYMRAAGLIPDRDTDERGFSHYFASFDSLRDDLLKRAGLPAPGLTSPLEDWMMRETANFPAVRITPEVRAWYAYAIDELEARSSS